MNTYFRLFYIKTTFASALLPSRHLEYGYIEIEKNVHKNNTATGYLLSMVSKSTDYF